MPRKKTKKPKNNLAVQLMPRTLDDIYGHEHIITAVKRWIEIDRLPYMLFVSGNSGTGKGCLVHNLIKTTLCLNREPGSSVACGKCEMCKLEPRTTHPNNNVMWVQPGGESGVTINQQFKDAMAYSRKPPTGNPNDYHLYHKFVVFDETQDIQTPLLSQLLYSSEIPEIVEPNRVTFIAITMDESKIKNKSASLHSAIKSRAGKGYLKLNPPSNKLLDQFCGSPTGLNVEDPEIRSALVKYAAGSYRMMIAGYEKLQDFPELDINLVTAALGCMGNEARYKLWDMFNHANSSEEKKQLKDYWEYIASKVGEAAMVNQILDDLCTAMTSKQNVALDMVKACGEYLKHPDGVPAYYIVIQPYVGEFQIELFKRESDNSLRELDLL